MNSDANRTTDSDTFECPRRAEIPRVTQLRVAPPPDHWRADGTCSWCHSISPAKFFEAIEAGCEIGPTDKNYKAYVRLPNPDVGKTIETGSESGPAFDIDGIPTRADLTDQEKAEGRYRRTFHGPAASHIRAKFYFQHLSKADRDRFIELHNAGKMTFAFPGHFYARPFFCCVVPPEGDARK